MVHEAADKCFTCFVLQLQEWICNMCQKRRHLVLSSGMWLRGSSSTGQDLPTVKNITDSLRDFRDEDDPEQVRIVAVH